MKVEEVKADPKVGLATLTQIKDFFSEGSRVCTLAELKALSPGDRDELKREVGKILYETKE